MNARREAYGILQRAYEGGYFTDVYGVEPMRAKAESLLAPYLDVIEVRAGTMSVTLHWRISKAKRKEQRRKEKTRQAAAAAV